MSILGLGADYILSVLYVLVLAMSVSLAIALHVYRPRAVVGPNRFAGRPTLPLLIALGVGICNLFLLNAVYVAFRMRNRGQTTFTPSPKDLAFLTTIPQVAAFAAIYIADYAAGGIELLQELGATIKNLFRGIKTGLIAALVILPPTYLSTAIIEQIYQRLRYEHPREHQILKVMHDSANTGVKWILVIGATLIAPVVEEFVFRGHIQTLVRQSFIILSSPRRFVRGFPLDPLAPAQPVLPAGEIRPAVWQTWLAIVVTSILFALVHDPWMRPPIFLLSLGLGYCYERTGNLWTNVTVHCLFNSVSTVLFLVSKP